MTALFLSMLLLFLLLFVRHLDRIDMPLIEGNDTSSPTTNGSFQNYDNDNNAYILAQKNAANIQFLNKRLEDIKKIEDEYQGLTNSVKINTTSIQQISKAIATQASQMTGLPPDAKSVPPMPPFSTPPPAPMPTPQAQA